jgi:hypothetical protein
MTTIKLIHGLSELAEVAAIDDELPIYDLSAADTLRISRLNLLGYKEYVALLTQTSTNAPTVVEVLNNTGATVTPTRFLPGWYRLTFSSSIILATKTLIMISMPDVATGKTVAFRASDTVVEVKTYNTSWALADGGLTNTPIIIRIYQ